MFSGRDDLVSVIMPAHNSAQFIEASIRSVLNQTYKNIELIVVDDCSDDSTFSIVSTIAQTDSRVKLLANSINSGAGVSRNKAIEISQGRYIAFLDSDDLWLPEKIDKQLTFMKNVESEFSFTNYHICDENGATINQLIYMPEKVNKKDLLKTCYIGCLTVIIDTHRIGKLYMPIIRRTQDYLFWLRVLEKVEYANCLNERLSIYRVRANSISRNKINKAKIQWNVYREHLKLNPILSLYYMIFYVYNGYKKNRAIIMNKKQKCNNTNF